MNAMTLVAVPEGGGALDVLATRYRAAFERMKGGRAEWTEGTLELAVVVAKAREQLPNHQEFSRWLQRHGLEQLHPNDRAALVGFAKDLQDARKLIEASKSISWRVIWETRPKRENAAPTNFGKGRISPRSQHDASGSSKRKRQATIPAVMREDYVPGTRAPAAPPARLQRQRVVQNDPPPARPERKGVTLKALTREQVDPDFVGTALEFSTKYGHVNLQTKQQIEHHKNQEELMAWLAAVSDLEKAARSFNAEAPDQDTLRKWLAKPGKTEKLGTWLTTIESAWHSIAPCLDLVRSRP